MPLRLAPMAAVGALLALGACSSDTKTVTSAPAEPPAPPPPVLTLPAAAAAAFPTGDTIITIRANEPDVDDNGNRYVERFGYRFICTGDRTCVVTVKKNAAGMLEVMADGDVLAGMVPPVEPPPVVWSLPSDAAAAFETGETVFTIRWDETNVNANGHRFVDRNGYRFICAGDEACIVTVTRNADGTVWVDAEGELAKGEIPAVAGKAGGRTDLLVPASGNRETIPLAAGASRTQKGVTMSCPAASTDGCQVIVETRTAGDQDVTDTIVTGGVVFAAFYRGLAYHGEGAGSDPVSASMAAEAAGYGATDAGAGNGRVISFLRQPGASADAAPAAASWGHVETIDHTVVVAHTSMPDDPNNVYAGLGADASAEDRAMTFGAVAVKRGLGLVASADYDKIVGTPEAPVDGDEDGALPDGYDANALSWSTDDMMGSGAPGFAGSDTRSDEDRWTVGFAQTRPLDGGTAGDTSDDGVMHIQVFTNYETGRTAEPADDFGDVAVGAIDGRVLAAAADGNVPNAPPHRRIFDMGNTSGTFNGVPGMFACANDNGCIVTTDADGAQTLAGGDLDFTPTTGVLMAVDDTDWLAIGSWSVAMDSGHTVVGAFSNAGTPFSTDQAALRSVQGQATYEGIARGHYAEYDDGARDAGVFGATAMFVADFGGSQDDDYGDGRGVYGTLREFSTTSHGAETVTDRSGWEIDFASETAPFAWDMSTNNRFGFGIPVTGEWGSESDNTLTGNSSLRLYGDGADSATQPTGIAGTFAAFSGTNDDNYDLTLIGAVGATR